jgi:hypothetical protein
MHPVVEELERMLMAPFRELEERLSNQFPNVVAKVYSGNVGSLTEYQGYDFVIDCLLTDAPDDQPDNVALSVNLRHLTTNPLIDADVCWGHPSGHIEVEFRPELLEVSDEVLSDLYADLPRLYEGLIEAVKRRKPSDWDEWHA